MKQTIWKYESAPQLAQELAHKKVVLVGGCFDLIHYGHFMFLTKARAYGDELVVALESDEHIATFKKRKPVHTQQERAEILSGMSCVSHVLKLPFFQADEEYAQMVQVIKPAVIAVSHPDHHLVHKTKHAELVGAKVAEVTDVIPEFATRSIIEQF